MKSGSLIFFLEFLALVFLASSRTPNALTAGGLKAGSCPIDNVFCFKSDDPECSNDSKCPGEKKCCYYRCGFKCVNPRGTKNPDEVETESCPPDNFHCSRKYSPKCIKDEECSQGQKCCFYHCGFKCVKAIGKKNPSF